MPQNTADTNNLFRIITKTKYCHSCREKGLTAELKIILIMLSRLWPNFSKSNLFAITKAENVVVIHVV